MSKANISVPAPIADIVFVNGKVVTVNSRDEVVEALAVRGNRILRVGSLLYVEKTVGAGTRVVNLKGRALIPGFVENHIHMTNSPQRLWVNCSYSLLCLSASSWGPIL